MVPIPVNSPPLLDIGLTWTYLGVVFAVCALSLGFIFWLAKWVLGHDQGPDEMKKVSDPVREGARGFLVTQYRTIAIFAGCFAPVIFLVYLVPCAAVSAGFKKDQGWIMGLISAGCFLLGATCSGFSGWMGMWVSVQSNVRTAAAALHSSNEAIKVALRGGAFSGMLIVTLSLFGVSSLFSLVFLALPGSNMVPFIIIAYGFGASFVALFAQLGGGIYTKAADVGADLVGKVDNNIPEDDPRNPAVIADLVGDNVGDCAGRGADLFESTAAENIGAMVIGGTVAIQANMSSKEMVGYTLFPLLVRAAGLIASAVGVVCVYSKERKPAGDGSIQYGHGQYVEIGAQEEDEDPLTGLNRGFAVTVVLCIAGMVAVSLMCLRVSTALNAWWHFAAAGSIGILISLAFVYITQYYTDYRFAPVFSIAEASTKGHGTNIIAGLAVGMESTALPVLTIVIAICCAYFLGQYSGLRDSTSAPVGGFYGTAVATMGMLMCVAFVLAMDTFGPIGDNAGGIVEMSQQPEEVRRKTDRLDAVGNTTKALTKGYAVGSAAMATFLLFSAFLDTVKTLTGYKGANPPIDIGIPEIFCGGLLGGMLVFLFSAWAIKAVGKSAQTIITECVRQFKEKPGIMSFSEKPDYQGCVTIVTKSALREMIRPAVLVILSPIVVGLAFRGIGYLGFIPDPLLGAKALASMLMIATMTGILLGLFLNNGGGAWDNAKKYIEMGNYGGKGSDAHKAAVTGDTVGDPCKDTAGPSIHVLIKLLSTITLVLAPIFVTPAQA